MTDPWYRDRYDRDYSFGYMDVDPTAPIATPRRWAAMAHSTTNPQFQPMNIRPIPPKDDQRMQKSIGAIATALYMFIIIRSLLNVIHYILPFLLLHGLLRWLWDIWMPHRPWPGC
ncbi:hypothetical protein NEOLEDRAFT_791570 [Neolentinus lepideus HHB14362 ss-1]|uniref:Uncharacterized protein n=1 Tax=Neolentinus lepideus HHB14362 ss-1 TaxID=1314782 RepID=A0A165PKG6_9AGAM|nr:hypothetical protein NEOLEDRAFT_791570 [Neolentinus lepideus HHB14362 ss-1]